MLIDTRTSPYAKAWPLPEQSIRMGDGFWKRRFDVCADAAIPHVMEIFDDADSFFHQVENFRIAAGLSDGEFRGTPFGDGDFYKLIEGLMYVYAKRKSPKIDKQLDEYIDLIAQCLQPDGYLSTKQIIGERQSNGVHRHGDINDFEEYNFGHMFTAACMHKRVTGKDNFMDVAKKVAGYLERMYTDAIENDHPLTAVCPSHYMGLVEMYRTTGDRLYLKLAEMALQIRDMVKNGTYDNQDKLKLRDQHEIVGHAVRSTYLYAGVADVYLENGDETLLPVIHDCWEDLVGKKLYVNGGCGALYTGTTPFGLLHEAQWVHQAFGYAYQLPNVTAYNETCGTLGHVFWTHRMFAIDPQARYFDLIERSSYNLALAAINLDGNKYFYENMLRRTKTLDYPLMWPVERADDFHCFCCPTNLARYVTQISEYQYMVSDDAVYAGMYMTGEADVELKNGAKFKLCQTTNYPWEGAVRFDVVGLGAGQRFTLKLRVPSWLRSGEIRFGGQTIKLDDSMTDCYVDVEMTADGAVELMMDMPARYTMAHAKVEEAVNQVCVERGPLVYCLETPDAQIDTIDKLFMLSNAIFKPVPYRIGDNDMIALETEAAVVKREKDDPDALYQPFSALGMEKLPVRLIPYFAWDNRGFGEMRVWMPVMYQF